MCQVGWLSASSTVACRIWSAEAVRLAAKLLVRAVEDPYDDEARAGMLLAASYAGIGFGNAGVHLPHGMSYPVAGMIRDYQPAGYNVDHPIAPHGISVILNTPAVARFTAPASPERHLRAAAALGADVRDAGPDDAAAVLADQVVQYLQDLRIPNGLSAIGYGNDDIPALVEGTLPQHRVTKLSPVEAGADELSRLFADSMTIW
ncbi:MAG: iron-containing alcohol dehydrogenase [Pirellulaceae bacterium]|nr:iron-containing alcohol dehydrogenase [Pirellulaceae bacterium]